MKLDDLTFIELARKNKDRAFSLLVDSYSRKIFSTCINLVRNQEDAEDVTQEVFTAIYLNLDKFKGDSKLSTWIYAVALNNSKEFLRKKTRKKRFGIFTIIEKEDSHTLPENVINYEHPGIQLENKERAAIFYRALDQLAENQKNAFILHKIEGVSYAEIADILETTIPSVESLMFRAKKKLKVILSDYYENNEI
tara:strand:- start:804 stop:1388 length:585 start_codon:yes stop_codon:yes gene_type:complete